jgi:O-antigen/teichoic acid export membrane protein
MISTSALLNKFHLDQDITSNLRGFWRSGSLVIGAMILGKSFSFVWKILLARLGSENLGQTQVVLTLLTLVSSLALLGFPFSLTRFISIAHAQKKKLLAEKLLYFVIKKTSTYSVLLMMAGVLLIPLSSNWLNLHLITSTQDIWVLLAVPFLVISEVFWNYFNARQQTALYAVGKYVIQPVFRLVLLLAFMSFVMNQETLILIHVIGATILAAILTLAVSRFSLEKLKLKLSPKISRDFVRYSTPIAGSLFLYVLFGSIDVFLLNQFTTVQVIGVYAVLVLLAELSDVFFLPFVNLIQPFMGSLHQRKQQGGRFILATCLLLLIGGGVVSFAIFELREFIINVIFGGEYTPAIALVGFILISKILESAFVLPIRHFLDFYGFVKETFIAMLLTLVMKISLGIYLVSQYQLPGLLITQISVQVFHVIVCVGLMGWLFRKQIIERLKAYPILPQFLSK